MLVLAVNRGSSSIKFAVYDVGGPEGDEKRLAAGSVSHVGGAALEEMLQLLARQELLEHVAAIGHRLVHGGARFAAPVLITPGVRSQLEAIVPLAPEHLPDELAAIDALRERLPSIPQVACFDTAFHRTLLRVATLFGLPRALADAGIIRYGFHGLSYEYIVTTLEQTGRLQPRTVIAHLGNGASLAAIRDGVSIDTTMGLTPTGGIVMGTRSGDIDPGVLLYLEQQDHRGVADVADLVRRRGGLLGISDTTSDMRDLLTAAATDPRAQEAIELFCYQIKKVIGAYAAALGGLDALVFTGGIGAFAAPVRARVCESMQWLGISIDPVRNAANADVISPAEAAVTVHVLPTNEELTIARHVGVAMAASRAAQS